MFRMLRTMVLVGAAVGVAQGGLLLASGSSAPAPSGGGSSMPSMSPEERAIEAYKSGDEHRVKGKKLEEEASTKQGADVEKTTAKAKSEYEKSLKDFKNAAKLNPGLYQAYNGMGYAYRKTGDYAKALEMYDQAIKLAPGFFPEAVEYRAEAYLALNRIDDARQAYLDLFAADRKQADILMDAMKKWVASRQAAPAGVAPDAITGFEKWIGEREGVAKQTQLMAITTKYAGW
ncbi:MAG TPA: tetratricopeptide repeat protein [Gemmatimonadaceae bacterium]